VYSGIYAVLIEQFVLAIVVGTLCVATPTIVGAATPSFAKWILAIVCYMAAGIQILGFIGVARERSIMYRRYVTLHVLVTVVIFALGATWIVISASRHSTAETNCVNNFFPDIALNNSTTTEAKVLCDVFPWVDVGIMAGLWVFFAAVQFYFYLIVTSYGNAQQRDSNNYEAGFDAKPLTTDIPLSDRAEPWKSRPSHDRLLNAGLGEYSQSHQRNNSGQSVSTVMGEPLQREVGGYDNYESVYPPRQNSTRQPANAYTQDPGPTPIDNYLSGDDTGGAGMNRPMATQAHPAEGSFRRKTPRLIKPETKESFDQSFFGR
jgi:hypothetical protein